MSSRVLADLSTTHIFTGVVAANGESITSNDGSATIATIGPGTYTITFGEAFRSTPTVVLTALDATYAQPEGGHNASITSVSTTSLVVQTATTGDADADGAPLDAICHILAVGERDN